MEPKDQFIGIRVTRQQRQKLEALAAANGVTLSWVMGRLLDEAVQISPAIFTGRHGRQLTTNANRGAVDSEAQRAAVAR